MVKPTPILEIDLRDNGGKQAFYSVEDFEKFLATEESFWKWLYEERARDGGLADVVDRINEPLYGVRRRLPDLRNHLIQKNYPSVVEQIGIELGKYESKKALHSSSNEAVYCSELYINQQRVACNLVGLFMVPPKGNNHTPEWHSALVEYHFYINGISKKVVPSLARANRELSQKLTEEIERAKAESETLKSNNQIFLDTSDKITSDATEAFLQLKKELTTEVAQSLDEAKKKLFLIEETYDKKLALQSSVTYWSYRKRNNYVLSLIAGFLTTLVMYKLGSFILAQLEKVLADEKVLNSKIAFASLIIISFIGIWFIRILVKLFMQFLNSANDAAERIVMLKAYLAMSREEQLDPKQKELITMILFRSTHNGFKDDGIPPSWWDLATRFKN